MPTDGFDPYHKWLGIPPEEQPPTHYRLLGIVEFETDSDVIANAASRQAFHLRQLQAGPQAALAQRLLKEVAAAKATLLNPDAKANYDQSLAPEVELPIVDIEPVPTFRRKPVKARGSQSLAGWLIVRVAPLALIAGVLLLVLYLSELKNRSKPDQVASTAAPAQSPDAASNVEPTPASPPAELPAAAAGDDDEPADPPVADSSIDEPDAMADPDPDAMEPGATESAGVEPSADTALAGDTAPSADTAPSTDTMPATDAMPPTDKALAGDMAPELDPTKEPVPSEDDQSKASKRVRSNHKADFAKAKTATEKVALARTLLAEGRDLEDNSTARYALFAATVDLAVAGGDFQLAADGWNDLGEHFQVDALAGRWQGLERSAKTKQGEAFKAAVEQFIADTTEQDRYGLAHRALQTLIDNCAPPEAERYDAELEKLDALATRYNEAQAALKTLATDATNPEANQTAGEFLSFFKLEWSRGMLLLSRASDATLKPLALAELAQPGESKEQVRLADAWWDFAAGQSDEKIAAAAKSRARFWYMEALPELKGEARRKAEQRATLEARVHGPSEIEAKITPTALKSKFQGKASYDAQTNQLTLVYDFQDDAQLKDFEGDAKLADGEIAVPLGESLRHVVKFKTLTMTGVVSMKSKVGDVVRSSRGLQAQRDAAAVKISSGKDAAGSSENGPADDDLVLPFEIDASDKLVLFRLGNQVVGKPMARSEPGQIQLCGGEAGAQFSQLVISGQPDPDWLAEFFGLPAAPAEKNASASASPKTKPAMKFERIEKVVLWNEHNSTHNNSGTRTGNLILSRNGKSVWQKKDLEIPWESDQPTKLVVDVPQIAADSVRFEITATNHENKQSGGLAEVEVFDKEGKNLALGGQVIVSAEPATQDPRTGANLIDGITDSATEQVGYWLLPVGQLGWAEIRLLPQEAPPAASKVAATTSKEPPPAKVRKKGVRKTVDAKIYVSSDDAFELYVNGASVLAGKDNETFTGKSPLAAGDVITVKATNFAGEVGFCCVIKLVNGQVITTSDGWSAYAPANPGQWFMRNQTSDFGPVVMVDADWPAGNVKKASGIEAAQIWAPGKSDVCYLFFVVGPLDIPKTSAEK